MKNQENNQNSELNYHYQCQRCKVKQTEFICQICKPINCFCSKCDSFVHNLPSKKTHKRDFASSNSDQPKEKIVIRDENTGVYQNKSTNFNTVLSSPLQTNKNFSNNNSMIQEKEINTSGVNNYHSQDNFTNQPLYQSQSANLSYIDEKKFSNSFYHQGTRLYTKEYVNELKNIFQKEKDELIFKNSSLQNNLDRLKVCFTDQIAQLQKEIEENRSKNNMTIRLIDEENHIKLKSLIQDKDAHIEDLNRKLQDYQKCNEDLLQQIKNNIKNNKKEKSDYKEDVKMLTFEIDNRDEQIKQLKDSYKNKIDAILKDNDNVKEELIHQSELRFNRLNSEKENLEKIIFEKENEINTLRNQRRADENYYTHLINDLKGENETLEKNIFNLKNESISFIEEIDKLKKNVNLVNEENDIVNRNTERMRKEILIKNEKIANLEQSLNSMRNEIDSLINKNRILQTDNELLNKNANGLRSNLSEKVEHLTYIENQNSFLQRENSELKSQLNRFERMYIGKLQSLD